MSPMSWCIWIGRMPIGIPSAAVQSKLALPYCRIQSVAGVGGMWPVSESPLSFLESAMHSRGRWAGARRIIASSRWISTIINRAGTGGPRSCARKPSSRASDSVARTCGSSRSHGMGPVTIRVNAWVSLVGQVRRMRSSSCG